MQKIFMFAIFLTTLFSGCKKVDKLTQFEMNYEETIVVPSSTGIDVPFNMKTPDIETESESRFYVNDTRKDLVEEIKLTALTLTLSQPGGEDFSFLNAIEIYITAEGLTETKVAWKENINSEKNFLELETADKDLKEYIKKDMFALKVKATTDELLAKDHHIDVHSVFFVDAKILGQ